MPLDITATCDICGARRQETNRWWIAKKSSGALVIRVYTLAGAMGSGPIGQEGRAILCGEVCLHKWVGANLGSLLEKEKEKEEIS